MNLELGIANAERIETLLGLAARWLGVYWGVVGVWCSEGENVPSALPQSIVPIASFCFTLFFFFWLHPQHLEIPRLRIEPVPQQWPKLLQGQSRILNPLCHKTPYYSYCCGKKPNNIKFPLRLSRLRTWPSGPWGFGFDPRPHSVG